MDPEEFAKRIHEGLDAQARLWAERDLSPLGRVCALLSIEGADYERLEECLEGAEGEFAEALNVVLVALADHLERYVGLRALLVVPLHNNVFLRKALRVFIRTLA